MKHILAVVAAVGLLISFWPAGATVVVPPSPVHPVSVTMRTATKTDKQRVSSFYAVMADVLERDPSAAKTVGQFTDLHALSLDRAFKGTDLPGKYLGLDKAINDALTAAVGSADVPLTPDKHQALVQALKEVASAAR